MSTQVELYGPVGEAVRTVAPKVETDPVGIYMATLSLWSAAISGTVTVEGRAPLVWSALVAKTGRGKGTALRAAKHIAGPGIGRFLDTHTASGLTSGASLVNALYEAQENSSETEHGTDVRLFVEEEEWQETLRRVKRDPSFTGKLRLAWDGSVLRNTTKEGPQEVRDPRMVMHTHCTPSDWNKYVSADEAAGGSYNRILPVILGSAHLIRKRSALPHVDPFSEAYAWATVKPRVMVMDAWAEDLYYVIRRYASILSESLPEVEAAMIQRTAEQTLRVAACLAAADMTEVITEDILLAAFSLVRRSVRDVLVLTRGQATAAKAPVRTLEEKVRERIASLGGKASSSDLLPFLRVSKAAVEAIPGIVMSQARNGKQGRPVTFYSFREKQEPAEPTAERPKAVAAATRPTPKQVTVRIPAHETTNVVRRQAAPVAVETDNPFAALV
ncbi:hypothetical protein [Streptomyces sp. NPDC051452]|uniref:hypothetical protein n=1 Tax=Streptomyces sp. NPDC051452 TaxID=3365654 RepID=UPI0037B12F1D